MVILEPIFDFLATFQNREDVKVMLLPISRGANGLNLVEASHVLLVEPILNPAQASKKKAVFRIQVDIRRIWIRIKLMEKTESG